MNKLESLPPELGKCVSLVSLDCNDNQLKTLPAELGNCVGLVTLNLQPVQPSRFTSRDEAKAEPFPDLSPSPPQILQLQLPSYLAQIPPPHQSK